MASGGFFGISLPSTSGKYVGGFSRSKDQGSVSRLSLLATEISQQVVGECYLMIRRVGISK